MNQTHIHLLITHLPIFGSILGTIVLIHGILAKSNQVKSAAYNLFVISSIGAAISYFTGEAAEESVEHIQGITKEAIDRHEDFALIGLIGLTILGVIALISSLITYKKSALANKAAFITLFISIVSFVLIARTGYLGGQIRHNEINSTPNQETLLNQGEKEEVK
jgi:uncharacterized membrane protein